MAPRWDGIDIAYPQPLCDIGEYLANGGPPLIIAKCSEGNYTDREWVRNMSGMRAHNVRYRGAYHFVTTARFSVEQQAQAVLTAWDPFLPMRQGEALFVDFEKDGGIFPDAELVRALVDRLAPVFSRIRIGEYSGPAWVQGWHDARLDELTLWASGGWFDDGEKAASYGAALWQYGGFAPPPPGIGGSACDVNMILDQQKLDILFGYEGVDQMEQSLIQMPETLPDGSPNPRAPEVWLAFGIFRIPVPSLQMLNTLSFIHIPGPTRISQEWFDMLIDATKFAQPLTVNPVVGGTFHGTIDGTVTPS